MINSKPRESTNEIFTAHMLAAEWDSTLLIIEVKVDSRLSQFHRKLKSLEQTYKTEYYIYVLK